MDNIEKIKELSEKLEKKKEKRDVLWEEKRKLDKKLTPLCTKISNMQEELDTLILDNRKNKDKMDMDMLLIDIDRSMVIYYERERILKLMGLSSSGYYMTDNGNQIRLQVGLTKDDDKLTKLAHKSIKKLLPYLYEVKEKNIKGISKIISIFEHTCSYYESYYLSIKGEKVTLVTSGYSYKSKKFDTLLDALKYVQKHHYYKETNSKKEL